MEWEQLRRKMEMDEAEENFTQAVDEYEEAKARLEVTLMLPPGQVDRLIQLKEEYETRTT